MCCLRSDWQTCVIYGTPSLSIFGSTPWHAMPRSLWSGCWEVSSGGATASSACHRLRRKAPSRLRFCRGRIAMILASPNPPRCRPTNCTACYIFFAKADQRIWQPCFGALHAIVDRQSKSQSRAWWRVRPDTFPAKERSTLIASPRSVRPIGRAFRSSSTARCCSQPIRRRSTHWLGR